MIFSIHLDLLLRATTLLISSTSSQCYWEENRPCHQLLDIAILTVPLAYDAALQLLEYVYNSASCGSTRPERLEAFVCHDIAGQI